jgi:glycosyltransferase involved in cell wall biosynthesis
MKILIVHPSFWIDGGAEKVIIRLANYLTDHNHPTTILTTEMIPSVRKQIKEARLLLCKSFEDMNFVYKNIYEDFDIVNFHNDPVELFAFGTRRPNVWCCNEPPQVWLETGKIDPEYIRITKEFITKVVVADEFNQKRFNEIYGKDSQIIPYGIDYEFFSEGNGERIREKYNLKDSFVITHSGFIHPMKNQMESLRTLEQVKKNIPNAKLVLAGYDNHPYCGEILSEAYRLGLEEDVIITGFLSQEDLRDLYHASDVMLFPIKSQGGWLSIFDAISTGKPVIVSEDCTAASLLRKNALAFVATNYVDAIMRVYNKELLTIDAAEWVKDKLTWDGYCERMVDLFKDVAKK